MYNNPLLEQIEAESKKQERLSRLEIVDGTTLLQTHYEEPRYLWDGILPDAGLAVCAALKAAGKTLLLLQMADAIAKGLPFLSVDSTPAKVLFLELELSQRRTAQRLSKMGITPNNNLQFAFKWQQGAPGLQDLADFIEEHSIKLAVVDVMQLLWPTDRDNNSYQDAYAFLAPLRQMANRLGVMILLVTHLRKQASTDYIDSVMGSTGIVANADVVLSLMRTRGESEAVLSIDGNDIESSKIALRFDTNPLGFQKSGADPAMAGQTQERKEIVQAISDLGGQAKTGEIAKALGKSTRDVSMLLRKLKDQGLIVSTGYGKYSLNTPIGTIGSIGTPDGTTQGTSNGSITSNGTLGEEEAEPIKRTGSSFPNWPAIVPQADEQEPELDIY
ncbi:MAG: hypothetical protein SAMD01599839_01320 [Rectinema sp.]